MAAALAVLLASTAQAQPNLVVVGVASPAASGDCESLLLDETVEVELANDGTEDVLEAFDLVLFQDLDLDGLYDPAADRLFGTASVAPPLAAGASLPVPVPAVGALEFRDAPLHAWADSGEAIAESSEDDNLASSAANCRRPPPVGDIELVVEWEWSYEPVLSSPMVGDVNADGTPDVVFASTEQVIYCLDGRTGEEHWRTNDDTVVPAGASTPAIGDIDGDPGLEVVSFANGDHLAGWDDDGSLLWLSENLGADHALFTGAVTLADLDCDGRPEAIYGPDVINTADGTRYWLPAPGGTWGSSLSYAGITSVADVNDDGILEVIAGPTAYVLDEPSGFGTGLWRQRDVDDGFTAVGQFDDDDGAEIVVVPPGRVALLEGEDGAVIWDVPLPYDNSCDPPLNRGGPPMIGDMDGDGDPEIGIANSDLYVVLEGDGSIKWQVPVQDCSSAATSSTLFDVDGDGAAEVIYQDEFHLHVFRGTDGFEIASYPTNSGTVQEMPVIADVDGDDRAEILANLHPWEGFVGQGIRVYGDAADSWVNARRIWNQHAYHVGNVTDDGKIPPNGSPGCVEKSWLTHGTYRLQLPPAGSFYGLSDLTATVIGTEVRPGATCGIELAVEARVGNAGEIPPGRSFDVWLYEGDPAAGGVPKTAVTLTGLEPGAWADVSLVILLRNPGEYFVVVDDDGAGLGVVGECREDNNSCAVQVDVVPPAPRLPDPVGPALRALSHGDPRAATITADFEWSGDEGLPRPDGEHYHLLRGTSPDALMPIAGTEPWTELEWTDETPASAERPTCHYLRVLAADACEDVEPAP